MSEKSKARAKATLICTILALVTGATAAGAIFMSNIKPVVAASYDTCLTGYTAKGIQIDGNEVLSIKNACNYCHNGSSNSARGVLWINDSMNDPRGNVIRIDSWAAEKKAAVIWGGVYSCGSSSGADNWANYVWFGLPGQMKGNGTKIEDMTGAADFFDLAENSFYGDSVYRAVFRGRVASSTYTWSNFDTTPNASTTPPNSYLLPNVAVFYPKKFREAALQYGTCSDIVEGGVTKLKCTMNISVNRCFDGAWGKYQNTTNTASGKCYGDPSELTLIAPPYVEGGFSSKSQVASGSSSSVSQNWDQDAPTLEVAANSSGSATIQFSHKIQYDAGTPSGTYNDASTSYTITIDDGSGGPWTGTYSTNGGTTAESGWLPSPVVSTTVNLGTASEKTVCSTITYTPKNVEWDANSPRNMKANTDPNNKGSTKACAKVKAPVTQTVNADGFWASSQVEVSAQNDVPGYTSNWVTTKGDPGTHTKVNIKLSTDANTLKVTFRHKMEYSEKLWKWSVQPAGTTDHPISASDKFPDICSDFEINWSGIKTGQVKKDKHCTNKAGTNSGKEISKTTNETITLAKGETKKLCQTLTHDGKSIKLKRTDKDKTCGTWPYTYTCHDYWDYAEESRTGTGTTEICVEVTRPLDPDIPGDDKITEDTKGPVTVSTNRMYAGQTADIGWSARAKSVASRRLKEFEAISYLVNVNKAFDTSKASYTGNIAKNSVDSDNTGRYPNRSSKTPCQYYQDTNKSAGWTQGDTWCETAGSGPDYKGTLNYGATEKLHWTNDIHRTVTVPDYVGYKYCNSFGYKWEYWYSISYDGVDDWKHEASKDYWTVYNSVCRTIAKKPSMAVWNGGIMTMGSIKTSIAKRYAEAGLGKPSEDASRGAQMLFGSWTEHLAVVKGSVTAAAAGGDIVGGANGFSSGAGLSRGNTANDMILPYSSMTVSNADAVSGSSDASLGYSGIDSTTTLRDRLKSYLRQQPTSTQLINTGVSSLGALTVSDSKTRIYVAGSGLTISGNIQIGNNYNSIYEIPQVLIFVDGDVTIDPSVQRIDAWIIATGKIETCAARSGNTAIATKANGYSGGTMTCDKQLVVNGPVIAGSTSLNRSYGADPIAYGSGASQRYTAAEIFNLSAETYLWAYAQAGRYGSSYTEAYSRELPPRY